MMKTALSLTSIVDPMASDTRSKFVREEQSVLQSALILLQEQIL